MERIAASREENVNAAWANRLFAFLQLRHREQGVAIVANQWRRGRRDWHAERDYRSATGIAPPVGGKPERLIGRESIDYGGRGRAAKGEFLHAASERGSVDRMVALEFVD